MSQHVEQAHRSALGHSSNVQLLLIVADCEYPLSEIGPNYVTLRQPAKLPAGDAEILMRVDGAEERWLVRLPEAVEAVPFDLVVETVDR